MEESEIKKRKVLLVDDDIEIREMYSEILAIAGYDTIEANDGAEGLEIAKIDLPDIIFTGINMPNMDGFTLMEKLKESPQTNAIPVVISSHMGKEEHRLKAEQLGAKDFIVKNRVTPRETVERMNAILSKGKEYKILFDLNSLDAPELLKSIGAEEISKCPNCDGKIALEVSISDFEKETMEARLSCSNCDWNLK